MYMREMGTVELLTREGEIAIAKRIEEGIRDVLTALAYFPGPVEYILDTYAEVTKEDKLADLLVGYLDPTDHVPAATQVGADGVEEDQTDDDDEEETKGPDPVEAKKRFTTLKRQYNKTQKSHCEKGRDSKEAQAQLVKLGEAFCCFKLVPKHFDEIVEHGARRAVHRAPSRALHLNAAVRQARVPRDVFRKEYMGNETSVSWINKLVKDRQRLLPGSGSAA